MKRRAKARALREKLAMKDSDSDSSIENND